MTYECELCHGTFNEGWDDKEAWDEYDINFHDVPHEEAATVCHDCFLKITMC